MAPGGLAVLASSWTIARAAPTWRQLLLQPLRTPVVIGCGLGLMLATSGLELPGLVLEPVGSSRRWRCRLRCWRTA